MDKELRSSFRRIKKWEWFFFAAITVVLIAAIAIGCAQTAPKGGSDAQETSYRTVNYYER